MSDHSFNTPPWLLDIVRKLDPKGVIGLDPCSNETSFVKARTRSLCLIPRADGMGTPSSSWAWSLRGRIKFYVDGAETKGPGKFASMIVYHGPATGKFMSLFEGYGWMA